VPRSVGDDELAPRRGEITVGHVDGDALFALGAQSVGEQRKVEPAVRLGGFANARELVFVDRAGIVKQAPDQRRLAVVYAAGGGKAQEIAQK